MNPIALLSRTGDFEPKVYISKAIPEDLTYIIRDEASLIYFVPTVSIDSQIFLQDILEYLSDDSHWGDEELEDYIPDTIDMALQYAAAISQETFFEWLGIFQKQENLRKYYVDLKTRYEGLDNILFGIYDNYQHFYDYQEINKGALALFNLLNK